MQADGGRVGRWKAVATSVPLRRLPATVSRVASRRAGRPTPATKPAVWLRVALAGPPIVLFVMLLSVRAVLALLLAGPR